jgi:hypothetical protein
MVVLNGPSDKVVLIAKPVGWSFKSFYYQRYHSIPGPTGQGNQGIVRRALAQAAIASFGTKGKQQYKGKAMPAVAVRVAAGIRSNGQVQALKSETQAKRESDRQAAHQAAVATWGGMQVPAF